uniref:Uncharacterized protein n=1 Tax=Lepeophtheirus salmonis TaxID=72036 RepID=A0A0K2TYR5_LEPSM
MFASFSELEKMPCKLSFLLKSNKFIILNRNDEHPSLL